VIPPERYPIKYSKFLYTAALALAPQVCFGQQTVLLASSDLPTAPVTATTTAVVPTSANTATKPLTDRWLDLVELSNSERYRNSYNQGGFHNFEAGQERDLLIARIKLDQDARYFIGIRASSGRYFNWAYAEFAGQSRTERVKLAGLDGQSAAAKTPAENAEQTAAKIADPAGALVSGGASNGWEFYVRELYMSATPVKAATVEFGSFGFERGYGSEITTFDNDGYLTGERVRIQDPKHLFFDQIGFTTADFGFVGTPNLFDRGSGFGISNYRQAFVKKQLNRRVGFSADYTSQIGTNTLRQAALVGTKESKLVDSVRVETYQRLNTITLQGLPISGGSGFAVTADKQIGKRLNMDAGFASIDENYTVYGNSRYLHSSGFTLNGDTYGLGNRPFTHASLKIAPGVTAFGYYTHAVGSGVAARVLDLNKQGLNAGLTFDFKAWANLDKKVF